MRTFFVRPDRVFKDTLLLDKEDGHHIRDVLRLKIGSSLSVSDGSKYVYRVNITGYPDDDVLCAIQEQAPLARPSKPRVYLVQAVPKGKRMDWLIQKATEVGVDEIFPVNTQRSVRFLKDDKTDKRRTRWQRIADEAAKQSGRASLPIMHAPLMLEEAVQKVKEIPLRIFMDPSGTSGSLRTIHQNTPEAESIALAVGPEGGFNDKELDYLSLSGFVSVYMGDLIMRVETAGVVAVALVRYEWRESVI